MARGGGAHVLRGAAGQVRTGGSGRGGEGNSCCCPGRMPGSRWVGCFATSSLRLPPLTLPVPSLPSYHARAGAGRTTARSPPPPTPLSGTCSGGTAPRSATGTKSSARAAPPTSTSTSSTRRPSTRRRVRSHACMRRCYLTAAGGGSCDYGALACPSACLRACWWWWLCGGGGGGGGRRWVGLRAPSGRVIGSGATPRRFTPLAAGGGLHFAGQRRRPGGPTAGARGGPAEVGSEGAAAVVGPCIELLPTPTFAYSPTAAPPCDPVPPSPLLPPTPPLADSAAAGCTTAWGWTLAASTSSTPPRPPSSAAISRCACRATRLPTTTRWASLWRR